MGWSLPDADPDVKYACSSMINGFNLIVICGILSCILNLILGIFTYIRYKRIKESTHEYTLGNIKDLEHDSEDSKGHKNLD